MAIPISIESLLEKNIVEWARIEFKEKWNPDPILKTISAFANDIDNWGGGYIVIGAGERNGVIRRPVTGLNPESIDKIQQELLRYCKFLRPVYLPVTEPVEYEGKHLLLVWVPGGYDRPYRCPKYPSRKESQQVYYIRKMSSTIEAGASDVKELQSLSHNIPFDDRINIEAQLSDLKFPLIQNYLAEINSALYQRASAMDIESLARDLRIGRGPKEYFKPLNVGLLFFHDRPEAFFPYSRIEVVNIPDPTGQGMEERTFTGPIQQQLRDALAYIKNNVITEKVFKFDDKAESERYFNYSYPAIEEFLSNAVYHKSYQEHEPVTVRIERESIEITSVPGPDRSITDIDIKGYRMRSRRYRNRRIGDFLKELHLVEGRNTGIPKAISAIMANKSPLPKLLTDEDRSFFSVILNIHPSFITTDESRAEVLKPVKTKKKRMQRSEIRDCILSELKAGDKSLNEIYKNQGYHSSVSDAFRQVLKDLIREGVVEYCGTEMNSSKNLLRLK